MNERSFSGFAAQYHPSIQFPDIKWFIMRQPETDMSEQIFAATERLMAKDGLHNLSMHKIAKEAKISAGTIYIYFKSKEELLEQFALRVFTLFQNSLEKGVNEQQPFFEQYRCMWWNIWRYLLSNPMMALNMHQYLSLPGFCEIHKRLESKNRWYLFCQHAQNAGVLCDLPPKVLFALSLKSAINLTYNQIVFKEELSEQILETAIERTWRSIQK